jgi:hypothetical protein
MLSNAIVMESYKSIIEEIVQGASSVNQSFMAVSIYISVWLLPHAEPDDLVIFQECVHQKTYDNIPYIFWLIFHFLYLGMLHLEKGELSEEELFFGREKILEFFADRGMARDLVLDYFVEGVLEYRTMAREAVGKTD